MIPDLPLILLAALAAVCLVLCWFLWRSRNQGTGDNDSSARVDELRHIIFQRDQQIELCRARELDLVQQLAAREQAIVDYERRLQLDKENREQYQKLASASALEATKQVSSQLLGDHKRESTAQRQLHENELKKLTSGLMTQVEQMSQRLAVNEQTAAQTGSAIDVMRRALSSPGGAGQASQTALANMLSSMGLSEGRDYILEYSLPASEGRKRPDAVVFLPGETLLVIDSKSSKYLLELAENEALAEKESSAAEATAPILANFKQSMEKHLKDLCSRDYRAAVTQAMRQLDDTKRPALVITLMWLPNEGALEKLTRADPQFMEKAAAHQVYPTSSNGLWAAIGLAEAHVRLDRQEVNFAVIAQETENLIMRLIPYFENVAKIETALTTAVRSLDKAAGSVNSRVLPSMKRLVELGVAEPTKKLPSPFRRFDVVPRAIDADARLIEVEDDQSPAIEDKALLIEEDNASSA